MKKSTSSQQLEKAKSVAEAAPSKMTASQKLESLEGIIQNQSNQIMIMAEELDRLGNVMTALAKRINAVVRSGDEGHQISSKQVNTLLVSDAAKELSGKVDYLISQGVLVLDNSNPVKFESFVVGREINSEKEEVNPRVQFAVQSLESEGQEKVIGKKVGELVLGDEGVDMEVLEIYNIVEPKAQE
jgi:hypothetical protein